MSQFVQKAKDVLHLNRDDEHKSTHTGHHDSTNYDNPQSSNQGPHSTNLGNAVDPLVDSKRGHHEHGSGLTDSHGSGMRTGGSGIGTDTYGSGTTGTLPHGSRTAGTGVEGDTYGAATTGSGIGSGTHSSGITGTDTYGSRTTDSTIGGGIGSHTHSSGSTGMGIGSGTHGSGMTGSDTYGSGTTGSGIGSGIGSDTYGSGTTGSALGGRSNYDNDNSLGGATAGSGNARKTHGPHDSDMLNKLDPRVDSDLDGSKTVGGNKTYN